MVLKILQYPDPILQKAAQPIVEITPEIKALAKDMAETMYAEQGIGLAAPQVGHLVRRIVVDVSHPDAEPELHTFINPELTPLGHAAIFEEGCLSVPDFRADVERAECVLLRALDLDGKVVELKAEDMFAICLQHEVDHLDGKLFIDRISRLKRSLYVSSVKKRLKREAQEQD
jgi:peptide deformylase